MFRFPLLWGGGKLDSPSVPGEELNGHSRMMFPTIEEVFGTIVNTLRLFEKCLVVKIRWNSPKLVALHCWVPGVWGPPAPQKDERGAQGSSCAPHSGAAQSPENSVSQLRQKPSWSGWSTIAQASATNRQSGGLELCQPSSSGWPTYCTVAPGMEKRSSWEREL